VSILSTSAIAVVLVSNVALAGLAGTTSLLLAVFTLVNIASLVLRRKTVEHEHFRAPTWSPWLGALPRVRSSSQSRMAVSPTECRLLWRSMPSLSPKVCRRRCAAVRPDRLPQRRASSEP
jgi:hypothetical protein